MLVFGKALAEHEGALAVDEVVLVKGRVDHKEAGKTCLVVQSGRDVRALGGGDRAGAARRPRPPHGRRRRWRSRCTCVHRAADLSRGALDDLKQAIEDFPGPAEVVLDIDTSAGTRRLRLGEEYRVQHTPTLRAELEHALAPRGLGRLPASASLASAALAQAQREARLPRAEAPPRFSPGVSSTHGRSSNAGADRNAAQPSSPSSPWADVGMTIAV